MDAERTNPRSPCVGLDPERKRGRVVRSRGGLAAIDPVRRGREARRRVEEVVHLYNTGPGTSAAALARMTGLAPLTVRRHLADMGIQLKTSAGRVLRVTEKTVRSIKADLIRASTTLQALADSYGIRKHVVVSIAMEYSWAHVPWPGGKTYTRRPPGGPKKLTAAIVRKIKADLQRGRLLREISEEYDLAIANVHAIAKDKLWVHVPWPGGGKYIPRGHPYQVKLTPQKAAEIKVHLIGSDLSHLEIAERYGVSEGAVRSIARGNTWKYVPWPNGQRYQGRERGKPPLGRRKGGMVLETAGRRREEIRKGERSWEESRAAS